MLDFFSNDYRERLCLTFLVMIIERDSACLCVHEEREEELSTLESE